MGRKIWTLPLSLFIMTAGCGTAMGAGGKKADGPRIVNIVNFIRQTDYRLDNAEARMFEAVERQIELVDRYDLPATFLFQYDALIDPRYQRLMKERLGPECEIGAWWEITQPHAEAAGIEWRGNHSWVSTAHIAFTPGYTKQEREKLVDVYMDKFREIYGRYPRSAGSWFIDSHTLAYMHERYGVIASCNCKDQVGTDGYTLWGGYWNQAYYPSRGNAYMPAQTEEGQIPVPVFRMLGSDPIHQYDTGVGTDHQGVITLEPVYREAGMNRAWVEYFLRAMAEGPSLAFNYAQAGQENSFTWPAMREGLEMQFPIFDSLRKAGRIRVETLEKSGRWFAETFATTPATAFTALDDVDGGEEKSVWYNSRHYRANLYWERDGFCFRDIHLFDEDFRSEYLDTPGTGGRFFYYTLPLVDRYHWSTPRERTGLRVVRPDGRGRSSEVVLADPVVTERSASTLRVESRDESGNRFSFLFREDRVEVSCSPKNGKFDWALELRVPRERAERLPFRSFTDSSVGATFRGFDYSVECSGGRVEGGEDDGEYTLRFIPSGREMVIYLANGG